MAESQYRLTSGEIEQRVTELMKRMTIQEKIGQLVQVSEGAPTGPEKVKVDTAAMAARGEIGSVFNITTAAGVNELQRHAVEKSRLKIPILFGLDVIHGMRAVYPIPLGLASSWNPDLAERCARIAAVEAASCGIRWTFSPMVDIARDCRWGRISEGSGEDPYLGSAMAAAWVRGYQGDNLSNPNSVMACAKHYVAYGAAEGGRDYNLSDLSERALRDVYLPPFKAAVDAGAGTLMSSFNTIAGLPATANRYTLTEILRDEWGFEGFVVSDWAAVLELIEHGVALDTSKSALKALTAGVDMDMVGHCYHLHLADLVAAGKLDVDVIDTAVRRVLRLKFALGLFEHPYTDEDLSEPTIMCSAHVELCRQAAEASFVLLKNDLAGDRPVLPIQAGDRIALIGELADSQDDMRGAWGWTGKTEDFVTLRTALAERVGDRLTYVRGVGPTDKIGIDFAGAVEAANGADVVVMALGETSHMSGEAASRATLDLPGQQLELLKAVVETGKPVVLVLFSGRPLAIVWEAEHVQAILAVWHPGIQAGPAIAGTLLGDVAPSGRLAATFPRSVGQVPLYYNTLNTGRPPIDDEPEGWFGTRYIDEKTAPLFPFGSGMSYTKFAYSATTTSVSSIPADDLNAGASFTVEATVANEGDRAGVETVQLYVCQRGTSVARPIRELKGFERVPLEPGESRMVRFSLKKAELAFWNVDMKHVVEPCELTVWIAPHCKGGTPATVAILES